MQPNGCMSTNFSIESEWICHLAPANRTPKPIGLGVLAQRMMPEACKLDSRYCTRNWLANLGLQWQARDNIPACETPLDSGFKTELLIESVLSRPQSNCRRRLGPLSHALPAHSIEGANVASKMSKVSWCLCGENCRLPDQANAAEGSSFIRSNLDS